MIVWVVWNDGDINSILDSELKAKLCVAMLVEEDIKEYSLAYSDRYERFGEEEKENLKNEFESYYGIQAYEVE